MTAEIKQKDRKIDFGKVKKCFEQMEKRVNNAVYTDLFLIAVLAVAFITWVTECATFGFVTLGILLTVILVFSHDILPLFAVILSASLMLYTKDIDGLMHLWPVFIPVGLALVVFFVRNIIRKAKMKDKFRLGKMFFPQLAVSVALLLGGVGVISTERYMAALPNVLILGVAGIVVYLIARNFISTEGGVDRATYFAKTLAYVGVVVALELVVAIAKRHIDPSEWANVVWHVGWGNRNNISTYLLFTAPMCFYLALKDERKSVFYIFLAAFQYICLVMTFSRGGILFGFIAMVIGGVVLIARSKNKMWQVISIGAVLGAVLIFYLSCMDGVHDVLNSLKARGTGLSGRESLYDEAIRIFKDNPFQGNGMGYIGHWGVFGDAIKMYWFHSTFSQVIACMGVIGLIAYGYSYGVKIFVLAKNILNPFNLFVIVIFIGFEGYSMMDTGTFIPGGYPFIVLILMCLVEMFTSTNEAKEIDKSEVKQMLKNLKEMRASKAKYVSSNHPVQEDDSPLFAGDESVVSTAEGSMANDDIDEEETTSTENA